jgi:class 3 adenylate cyclase
VLKSRIPRSIRVTGSGEAREGVLLPRYHDDVGLFLDRHNALGATAADIAAAHELDLAVQDQYGVRYLTYWFDEDEGTIFCLAEGRDRAAVETVHREAHGLMADNVIEVGEGPINAFLGEPPRHPPGEAYTDSAVRAILFTDFCGSTQMTQELGDDGFMCLLREHDQIVRSTLDQRGGREVKHTGDGIMASFSSVVAAVASSVDIQTSVQERNKAAESLIRLRIGISVGEPVTESGDLFGATVQLSARLCEIASPGCIAVSNAVREVCAGKSFRFAPLGDHGLKGFPAPVPVFEVCI